MVVYLLSAFFTAMASGSRLPTIHANPPYDPRWGHCKPIPFEACKNVGYNLTAMPNLVGIELESEAEYSLGTFKPLVKFGCSSQLQFLLCAFYAPMCTPQVPSLIGPCRPLCEGVRDRCAPVLRGFGFPWPSAFNCSLLPALNDERHMCMEGPPETVPLPPPPPPMPPPRHARSHCAHLAQPQLHAYVNASGRCAPLCGADVSFSSEDKAFAAVWMAIWSVATFCMGMGAVATLLLDSSLFRYPDRAGTYICLCYALVAAGYLVRLGAGGGAIACRKDPELGVSVGITEGGLSTPCVAVFLLLYYFSLAAGVWWVLHSACWFAKAWRGVSHERFLLHSSGLHALGWGSPAGITTACLVLRKVEADELTRTCFAGGEDPLSLVRWVIVPQFLFVAVGGTFVLCAFAVFWRNRTTLARQSLPHAHIDVAAARGGVMSVLYMVPGTCLLSISFYELTNRALWRTELGSQPSVEIYMLKIFMTLCPGLFIGLFLINNKVLSAWKKLWYRLARSKPSAPSNSLYLRGPPLMDTTKNLDQTGFVVLPHHCTILLSGCPTHDPPKSALKKKEPSVKCGPETRM